MMKKLHSSFAILALLSSLANATPQQAVDLATAAESLEVLVSYVSGYQKIAYPNGDVNQRTGVCSDVVIRAYRKIGLDLQQLVHQDMLANFSQYPSKKVWGLTKPDTNIDHRRVLNLEKFFSRQGITKKISDQASDYQPGDIVSWRLNNGLPHIGIVTSLKSTDQKRYLVKHNIGFGQVSEDVLFSWKIVGHYQYPQ